MSPDLDKKLVKEFPILYRDRYGDMRSTCMCWGFDIGDGWVSLLWKLSEKLESIAQKQQNEVTGETLCTYCARKKDLHHTSSLNCYTIEDSTHENCKSWVFDPPILKATQVKEKFGTLRFYTNYSSKEIDSYIREAEELSAISCEACGEPGELRGEFWVVTLCDRCWKERNNKDNHNNA